MALYGHPTWKRTTVWATARTVSQLHRGKLKKGVRKYRHGVRCWQGSAQLRSTQLLACTVQSGPKFWILLGAVYGDHCKDSQKPRPEFYQGCFAIICLALLNLEPGSLIRLPCLTFMPRVHPVNFCKTLLEMRSELVMNGPRFPDASCHQGI